MSLFDDPDVGLAPEPTFSVTELADAIGNALRARFREEVWVRGEIRDLSRPASGHVYFTLTDPTGPSGGASLPVMLSARHKGAVNVTLTAAGGGVRMSDGTDVRVRGRVDWYAPRGQLQLRMTAIDPAHTLGQLEVARAELLRRLEGEGLLRANAAHPLPAAPLRVGLVTSQGSAAEADFLDELRRSGFAFQVLRVDTRVQGPDAPRAVAAAVRMIATHPVDVIALVRGGGARTDLAAFDDEAVARAVAGAPVPVLTGIGHEVDTSVADEVAHTQAKTPTACAQLLVAQVAALSARLEGGWSAIATHATREIGHHDRRLHLHATHLSRSSRVALDGGLQRLDAVAGRARRASTACLESATRRLDGNRGRVTGAARSHVRAAEVLVAAGERRIAHRAPRTVAEAERAVDAIEARVRALDPTRALARGWSITRRADGQVVRSPADVAPGDELATVVAGGEVRSTVTGASTVGPDA
ncbi:MAG: exodeoxyribonuclease VII large subunit [Acidimicrobiales bacterium]